MNVKNLRHEKGKENSRCEKRKILNCEKIGWKFWENLKYEETSKIEALENKMKV